MNDGVHIDGEKYSSFRIKEMGDGFLCSIGFPFAVPDQIFAAALEFSYRFHKILQDSAQRYLERTLNCGIGISYGEIGGFFPQGESSPTIFMERP